MNTLNAYSLEGTSNMFQNNFSKKTLTQNMVVKFFFSQIIRKYSWKIKTSKNENMENGAKASILLQLHKNTGHITNFSLLPHLKWNNQKLQAHEVWSMIKIFQIIIEHIHRCKENLFQNLLNHSHTRQP